MRLVFPTVLMLVILLALPCFLLAAIVGAILSTAQAAAAMIELVWEDT